MTGEVRKRKALIFASQRGFCSVCRGLLSHPDDQRQAKAAWNEHADLDTVESWTGKRFELMHRQCRSAANVMPRRLRPSEQRRLDRRKAAQSITEDTR